MSEPQLQLFLENAPTAIAIFDRDMRYLCASRRWLNCYGLAGSVVGRTHYDACPDASVGMRELHRRALEGEMVAPEDTCIERADGSIQWLRWDARPWRSDTGMIGGAVVVAEDITELKRVEELARRDQVGLQLALDAASMICFEWDIPRDQVRRFEPVVLSPPRPQAFNNFAAVCEAVHWDDRDRFRANVQAALAAEEGRYENEIRIVSPNGRIAWFLERGRVERDANGQPARLIGVAQEITECKRVEEALRNADRRKDEFLATLAHELRNPLAPIRNAIYALKKMQGVDPATGDQARSLISMAERQVDHLVRLVDDLLEMSRITTGKILLKKRPVDLVEISHRALEISQPHLEVKQHEISISVGEQPLVADGDPVRLAQVFSNLLNNAAKFTPANGKIDIELKRSDQQAIVSVRDNGVGIPAELLPRVFELFTQSSGSRTREQGGLGIGLALVRSLVEMHGGSVEARSEGPGLGSELVVRLPLTSASAESERIEGRSGFSADAATRRVLVVDDDRDVADSLVTLLELVGADVEVAYDGKEAIASVTEFKPSLAFLDIGMPGIDGYETARRIRLLPEGRNVILIALSGWGQTKDRQRALEAGFDHHFMKPITMSALQELFASLKRAKRALVLLN